MLDSPRLTIPARRAAPVVEDVRPSEAVDDPIQRRDLVLLEQARDGSLDAFNSLVECYQDHLFALVARMVPDRDQAGDAVQEAFFSAYRNMRSFRGGSVRSWLSRIAINAAMDQQRLKKRRPVAAVPRARGRELAAACRPEDDPVRTAMHGERSRVLAAALAAITPDQRYAIVLFDVEGYDYAEIAELTGVSLGTVKSRIHRGRLALRDRLEGSIGLFRGEDG